MNGPQPMTAFASQASVDSGDPYVGSPVRQWWLVVVLTCIATLGGIDRQIMALLIEPIRMDLGLSDTQISVIYGAAFALANVLLLLPAGYLADRMDRRLLLAAGLGIWSLATMTCGVVTSYAGLFLARAFVGGGESVLQPGALSLMRNAVRKEWLGRAYSIYAMAIMLGTALAMAGGGAILAALAHRKSYVLPIVGDVHAWQITLLLLGLVGIPACLLLATLREPRRAEQEGGATVGGDMAAAWTFIWRHRGIFVPLLLFNATAGMLTLSYGAWVTPILVRSWGYSLSDVGAKLGLMMLVIPPIGLIATGWAMDRFSRRYGAKGVATVGLAAITALTLSSVGVPLMPTTMSLWVNMAFALLASGTCFPITNTIVAMIAPSACLGRISSIQYLVYGVLGASIGPTVVALVSDHLFSGHNALANALAATCSIYGLVALILLGMARAAIARSEFRT